MKIEVYTDGACRGNQFEVNIGAWAYYIKAKTSHKEYFAENCNVAGNTTNNIMELTAVIEALKTLSDTNAYNDEITVYSDSTYVVMGITAWFKGWIKKNWKDVKNKELWIKLLHSKNKFTNIRFQHVAGHSGNKHNEYVDRLCNEAMDNHLINHKN